MSALGTKNHDIPKMRNFVRESSDIIVPSSSLLDLNIQIIK